ncbi:hypothetical protein DFS34DRAFT_652227 [Phlyctochytrium arcticum]|nr:hypothetical protein DFS34DRAFT_652227 [Phlyctochytrium arcticum]
MSILAREQRSEGVTAGVWAKKPSPEFTSVYDTLVFDKDLQDHARPLALSGLDMLADDVQQRNKRRRSQAPRTPIRIPSDESDDSLDQFNDSDAQPLLLFSKRTTYVDVLMKEHQKFESVAMTAVRCQKIAENQNVMSPSSFLSTAELDEISAVADQRLQSTWNINHGAAEAKLLDHISQIDNRILLETLVTSVLRDADWQCLEAADKEDASYILELLRRSTEAMNDNLGSSIHSERDLDVSFHQTAFSVLHGTVGTHFGEVESRASKDRRIRGSAALNLPTGRICGQYVDWLWVRSQTTKFVKDQSGLLLLLRDIHISLARRVLAARPHEKKIRRLIAELPVVGITVSNMRYTVVYLSDGFYVAKQLASFDAPVINQQQFPNRFRAMCINMLAFKATQITEEVDYLLDNTRPLDNDVSGVFDGNDKWEAPNPERTVKKAQE